MLLHSGAVRISVLLAVLATALPSAAASPPSVDLVADDPAFGLGVGEGAAGFRPFDFDFPDVATKNCSQCGGRDGCVGCLCVKKCQAPAANESLPFLSRTLGSHMVLQRAPAMAMVFGHAKQGAMTSTFFYFFLHHDHVVACLRARFPPRSHHPRAPSSRDAHFVARCCALIGAVLWATRP